MITLEVAFSYDEIKCFVWDSGGDRAPRPDGFVFAFFKAFWSTIGENVIRLVQDFYVSSSFPIGCNPSCIALIPKISDPKFVSNFRPISLIGCRYKVIGKIFANRLSLVISHFVSFEQSVFIKGRNMMDGLLVLNEVMDWYQKQKKNKKKSLLAFKSTLRKLTTCFDGIF